MTRPTLFIGIDALLVPGDDPDTVMGAEIAPHAKAFLSYAVARYQVQILSDRKARDVSYLIRKLGLPADSVLSRTYFDSKVPLVQLAKSFLWIDTVLIPSEISWLAQNGHVTRYMSVDPDKGVGSEHKQWLSSKVFQ